ncbi:protein of unknown function [Lishizhenia tianjinensis]|uniref:DUF4783 domain-containing protein n=1 Tax=Lishizhenia tianjinensis TaxID=477690 RepID=A0A1I7BP24_9FLAO|nr:DUF4783 domain-containing protein [Lishizhenia tianjinensis]SFT88915.1 protein of unknown function [Lishizhenia tianjinensis]
MKLLLTVLTTIIFSISIAGEIPYDALAKNFSSQRAGEIIKLGKEKIAITVYGKTGVYSHQQGELVLNNFFKANPAQSFKFIFKGKKHGNSSYAIGTYVSDKSNFRITLQFKLGSEGNYLIERLTIEKE